MATDPPNTDFPPRRKGRGPGKRPALVGTSLRLPAYVVEFFRQEYPFTMQAQMRGVLTQYVKDMQKVVGPRPVDLALADIPEPAPGLAQDNDPTGAS